MKKITHQTLEKRVELLIEKAESSSLSLETIIQVLSGKGRTLLIILLSLPFCLPLQIPGFSTPFGVVIAFLGLRNLFGRRVWLPKRLLSKKISRAKLKKIAKKGLWLIRKSSRFLHPRLLPLSHHAFWKIFNSSLLVLMGICLALPLPIPFTNLTSAWSILLLGLGIIEDDGLLLILGYIACVITFAYFYLIGFSLEALF